MRIVFGVLVGLGVIAGLIWAVAFRWPSELSGQRAAPAILIENARLVPMVAGEPDALEAQDILVIDGVIAARVPHGALVGDPRLEGAERIDAAGRTVLPGLIDAHVHVWD
ncbi:MAG TPA: hypothetical protein DIW38_11490, partial [Oceanicaulis sp.]|nr:hypothetical protein [Oceanicaulis sp.]